ncbi:hypothetical protein [Roseiflexus castenholzii]
MLADDAPWPYLAQVFQLEQRWWDAKGAHNECAMGARGSFAAERL